MNSNGDHSQSGYVLENQRGNNRYRGGPRRDRGRGNQDKRGQNRAFRDRKSSNWREQSRTNEVIDINDSSQWPSIQESSSGVPERRTNPAPKSPDNTDQPRQEFMEPQSRQPRYNANQQFSPYYRDQQTRYSNRGRGPRYNSQGRYPVNYNRRLRPSFTTQPYLQDPMLAGFYNSQFMVNPHISFPVDPPPEPPKDIDAVKQVEFYFSIRNLEGDFYMRSQMDEQGWVDLAVVHKFNRIQALNIKFEDFCEKLVYSQLIDFDLENKRIRAKVEPEKWAFDPETRKVVLQTLSQNQSSASSHNEIGPNGYIQSSYSTYPPMFVPASNYGGRGGRYYQQYGMYPPSPYYGFPCVEGTPEIYAQYYQQDYNFYSSGGPFYNQAPRAEEITNNSDGNRVSQTQVTNSQVENVSQSPVVAEPSSVLEDVSKRMEQIEISHDGDSK